MNMERVVLGMLPSPIRQAVAGAISMSGGHFEELRLYRGGRIRVLHAGRSVYAPGQCSPEDFDRTLRTLCGNSLYSHSETMRDGYVITADGLRVGVCGRAVLRRGEVDLITDITSLCIRIPGRYPEIARPLMPYILTKSGVNGMLVFSAPGVGKTTLLRELADLLSSPEFGLRCAVVDTRMEIGFGLTGASLHLLRGYPRALGMETAVRTLSPDLVICDEISDEKDADAVLYCASSGAAVIASAHAAGYEDLWRKPALARLLKNHVFAARTELFRQNGTVCRRITTENGEASCAV